jgi:hypothetical protein
VPGPRLLPRVLAHQLTKLRKKRRAEAPMVAVGQSRFE